VEDASDTPAGPADPATVEEEPTPGWIGGPPLARVLVESGRVAPEQMLIALQAHQETGESLARYLFNQGLAKEDDLVWAMAQEVGLEFVDLTTVAVDRVAAALIPEATARHHMVLPIAVENGVPVVAMANPTDVFAMDDLRTIMGRNFTPVVATRSQIANFLRFAHDSDVDVAEVAGDAEAGGYGEGSSFELESLQAVVEDAPIVRYVNLLILQALNERASDIHIEPTPKRLRIRFRIDGVMHDATSASSSIASAVVSRLKVLGEMDITEHRVPQEGRVSLSVSDRQIDLRMAVLPSIYGETVVMRLLDKSASLRTLPELGFAPDTLERYAKAYHQPYGVILVTGPTGAGKTTTLYATLAEVQSQEKSVVTVEDPVEYQIDGITQVQINPKAGLVFSNALKSILRSDPDIVLIGEIRDADTAKIAMEAALSGHLVLTTLHTNTAAATPLRLTEMGIEPFLVTSALGSVLTQRLARVLCPNCKEPYEASEQEFVAAGYSAADLDLVDGLTLHRAVGCRMCGHTGYQGRMVLSEVMNMSEEIDRMIIQQMSIVDMERKACEQGMRTLRQDGLLKAVSGQTTLEEVLRVVV
jgi:type IV pilus assembly protein PilB